MQETWVRSLGWEDSLKKGMVTHSSILAWEIPWTEKPGRLPSTGSPSVRHDLATKQQQYLPKLSINLLLAPLSAHAPPSAAELGELLVPSSAYAKLHP